MTHIVTVTTKYGPCSFKDDDIQVVQALADNRIRVCTATGWRQELTFNSNEESKEAGDTLLGAMRK